MIHVVTGESAAACLKSVFHRLDQPVIELPVDFSVGPIAQIHQKRGISTRFDWIEHSFNPIKDHSIENQNLYLTSLEALQNVKDSQQVTIWTCDNAAEQIGLRISCFLLRTKQVELYMVNTQHAIDDYFKDQEMQQILRHSGECCSKQLAHFYKYSSMAITKQMRGALENDAEKLLDSNGLLRSWKQNNIVEDEETREDKFILECIQRNLDQSLENDYVKTVRIVGEVLSLSDQSLSDVWIDYRIRSLIKSGQLAYQGDLHSMCTYQVKVPS